jgi:thermolabile hemolysin
MLSPAWSRYIKMQTKSSFLAGFLLFWFAVNPTQAAFTSLYVFGDGISTTTNNPSPGSQYYGKRYTNGRVWVEVLAQRQALTYEPNKNWSYFYNSSTTMLAHVISSQPTNAGTSLFVIWVNCADLWFPAMYSGTSLSQWTNAINQSQINHYKAATNLYAKGARTLIMPNAVDLSTIPEFNQSVNTNFIRQRCLDYNIAFSNTLNRIRTSCPDLTLYSPDFFALLTNMIAHPASYGLTNLLDRGRSVDALDAQNFGYPRAATNGYGTNYIFWNVDNPTAMVHAWMANNVQQLISPVRIARLTLFNGSNRLDLVNVPIGQNGLVLGCTNVVSEYILAPSNWTANASFISVSATQSVFVLVPGAAPNPGFSLAAGPLPPGPITVPDIAWQLYRLQFPYAWTWP